MGSDDGAKQKRRNQCRSIVRFLLLAFCVTSISVVTLVLGRKYLRKRHNNNSPTLSPQHATRRVADVSWPQHLKQTEKSRKRNTPPRSALLNSLSSNRDGLTTTSTTSTSTSTTTTTTTTTTTKPTAPTNGPIAESTSTSQPNAAIIPSVKDQPNKPISGEHPAIPKLGNMLFADRLKKAARNFLGKHVPVSSEDLQQRSNKSNQANLPSDSTNIASGPVGDVISGVEEVVKTSSSPPSNGAAVSTLTTTTSTTSTSSSSIPPTTTTTSTSTTPPPSSTTTVPPSTTTLPPSTTTKSPLPSPPPHPTRPLAAHDQVHDTIHHPDMNDARRNEIVEEFVWSWNAYKKHAWGKDELLPISKKSHKWFGIGLTLLDNLDTLWLMGLTDEFKEATKWVENELHLDVDQDVNLFECTIRALGGLLSAHALSGQHIFLEKAQELGNRLLPAFDSESGIPFSDVNLKKGTTHAPKWGSDSSTAEVTTVQLEFHRLTQITGDARFSTAADRVSDKIAQMAEVVKPQHHLLPIFINAQSGKLSESSTISLGARGDSYYEYLMKQWIQAGGTRPMLGERYVKAAEAIRKHLIVKSKISGTSFVAEMNSKGSLMNKMDHLVCFLPGVYVLGAKNDVSKLPHVEELGLSVEEMSKIHLELAKDLMETCYSFYRDSPTGLSPEIVMFDCDKKPNKCKDGKAFYIKPNDEHNLLRPETVESLFILWRLTKDPKYRVWGWKIFKSFQKYCKISTGGYSSIKSVVHTPVVFKDKMESFWLAETLKYLFLLFSDDDVLPLDKWVLNTEAHPFPIVPRRPLPDALPDRG